MANCSPARVWVAEGIGQTRSLMMLEGGSSVDWLVAYVGRLLSRHPVMMVPAGDAATGDRLSGSYCPAFRHELDLWLSPKRSRTGRRIGRR